MTIKDVAATGGSHIMTPTPLLSLAPSQLASSIDALVRPRWKPLDALERGWQALSAAQRTTLTARLEDLIASGPLWNDRHPRDAMLNLMTFLAQVEVIAVEVPLALLQATDRELDPVLRRQLGDEVFHGAVFARIAHALLAPAAHLPPPLASVERLLDRIRREKDRAIAAMLLNLIAEGWTETLFAHARRWGIADSVFDVILADESRHVEEAGRYIDRVDLARAQPVLSDFEAELLPVLAEPALALSIYELAGHDGFLALTTDLLAKHRQQLAAYGLEPSPPWRDLEQRLHELLTSHGARVRAFAQRAAIRVEDTPWRLATRRIWADPDNPTMRGGLDVPIGHVPRKLITACTVAAVGRAWASERGRRLNRVIARDAIWQLDHVHVGVRVLIEDDVATVVVTEAERRSPRDIVKMLEWGRTMLMVNRERAQSLGVANLPFPRELASLMPAAVRHSVTISNVGKSGLTTGSGALSPFGPTTDISIGERRRLPLWRLLMYWPAWHVHLGCVQDHRVLDGQDAGLAMTLVRDQLVRREVRALLSAPDTITNRDAPVDLAGTIDAYPGLAQHVGPWIQLGTFMVVVGTGSAS